MEAAVAETGGPGLRAEGFCSAPAAPGGLEAPLRGSLYDSGTDDSGSKSISPGSSLNSSEEDLRAGVASSQTPSSTAKLGDTRELEAFIADLDQILKEM
ncbi:hypothetical protein E2320_013177 [Naja naja]|nr:hypothetical protein E2320_013177 [Naja naja]